MSAGASEPRAVVRSSPSALLVLECNGLGTARLFPARCPKPVAVQRHVCKSHLSLLSSPFSLPTAPVGPCAIFLSTIPIPKSPPVNECSAASGSMSQWVRIAMNVSRPRFGLDGATCGSVGLGLGRPGAGCGGPSWSAESGGIDADGGRTRPKHSPLAFLFASIVTGVLSPVDSTH